jgi:uncharacterized protein YukE
MPQVYFQPDDLSLIAYKLRREGGELSELIARIDKEIRYLETLEGGWQGVSGSARKRLVAQWNTIHDAEQALQEFSTSLQRDAEHLQNYFRPFEAGTAVKGFRTEDLTQPPAQQRDEQPKVIRDKKDGETVTDQAPIIRIGIAEEPLTLFSLASSISALTELSTKYWLIAKGRFADLIEYTQTHNGRFVEEANVVVTKITYNSPMNMDWKVDLSAPSVAEALITTIDGITQASKRLKQKELENQAKAQEIQHIEQRAAHEQRMAALEQEQRRLEIEKQRLEVLEKQLEVQKKGIEYALEIAGKVVDLLRPGTDPTARAMEIQALLPNLVQLQNGKGLELALPATQNEKPADPERG